MGPLAVFLLFLASPAGAIFTPTQMARIDHEPLFDKHYFVSLLSFSHPEEWSALWRSSAAGSAYRLNAASLDCCELLLNQELRFRRPLTDGLAFKFRLIQQDDKERQELHHWLELEQRLWAGFSASIFGEPAFQKGNSDIGLGLSYASGGFGLSARRAFVDFDFNRRSGTNETYNRKAVTDEFSVAYVQGEWSASAWAEFDHPLSRVVPDEAKTFSYRRTTAHFTLRQGGRRLEYSYEFQRKGDRFNTAAAGSSMASLRQVHQILAAAEGSLSPKDRLEVGHALLERAARTDFAAAPASGVFYRRWEAQPYARWRRAAARSLTTDLGVFLSFGENRRRYAGGAAPAVYGVLVEAKLGAGVDFLFPSGRIGLYATGKLDDPAHPFGGGNARAMFFF